MNRADLALTWNVYRQGNLTLTQLIYATRYRRYTVDVHRFIALLGMLDWHGPPARYDWTTEQCCLAIFTHVIHSSGNLDMLSFISKHEDEAKGLILPSWCSLCTWYEEDDHPTPLLADLGAQEMSFQACKSDDHRNPSIIEAGTRLVVWGYIVDELRSRPRHREEVMQAVRSYGYERFIACREPYITRDGYRGLVPVQSEAGDHLCIIVGGKTPYILRPAEGGYKLIGEW